MKNIYPPEDYNTYHVLKVPVTILLLGLYLLKHPFFLALPYVIEARTVSDFAATQFDPGLMVLGVVAALWLFIGMSRRVPGAAKWVEWMWKHTYGVLIGAVALDALGYGVYLALGLKSLDAGMLGLLYLDAMILFFLYRSTYSREMFQQFPQKETPKKRERRKVVLADQEGDTAAPRETTKPD